MVVDFPAPFGPRKPKTSPRGTTSDRSTTASVEPNRLLSRSMRSAGTDDVGAAMVHSWQSGHDCRPDFPAHLAGTLDLAKGPRKAFFAGTLGSSWAPPSVFQTMPSLLNCGDARQA
jgi:hypothetical protein